METTEYHFLDQMGLSLTVTTLKLKPHPVLFLMPTCFECQSNYLYRNKIEIKPKLKLWSPYKMFVLLSHWSSREQMVCNPTNMHCLILKLDLYFWVTKLFYAATSKIDNSRYAILVQLFHYQDVVLKLLHITNWCQDNNKFVSLLV